MATRLSFVQKVKELKVGGGPIKKSHETIGKKGEKRAESMEYKTTYTLVSNA